jgi:hypothetical protein
MYLVRRTRYLEWHMSHGEQWRDPVSTVPRRCYASPGTEYNVPSTLCSFQRSVRFISRVVEAGAPSTGVNVSVNR